MEQNSQIMQKIKIFNGEFHKIKFPLLDNFDSFEYKNYPIPAEIEDVPGIYFILGKDDDILYIGKALKLRNRLSAHLSPYSKKSSGSVSWIPISEIKKVSYLIIHRDILELFESFYFYFYKSKYNHGGYSYKNISPL